MPEQSDKSIRIERNLEQALGPFIVRAALPKVLRMLDAHPVRIAFSSRKGRTLGYYMSPKDENRSPFPTGFRPGFGHLHTISLQVELNPYALLFVFLHEWAHLLTHDQFGDSVTPHGKEWKENFRKTFEPFHSPEIFPGDILSAIDTYFVKTSRYFEIELQDACNRYGKSRKAFMRTYLSLLRKGIEIPAPRMGQKAERIKEKNLLEKERERENRIRQELQEWNRQQSLRKTEAEKQAGFRSLGLRSLDQLPQGSLFYLDGEIFRLSEKDPVFAKARSLSDNRIVRIHKLVRVEALEEAPLLHPGGTVLP